MTNLYPNDARKQPRDEQGKPDIGSKRIWKRPRTVAPMPTLSPYEKSVRRESRRFIQLYGR